MDLREERRERILATDSVPFVLDQLEPVAVVNLSICPPATAQYVGRDFPESASS